MEEERKSILASLLLLWILVIFIPFAFALQTEIFIEPSEVIANRTVVTVKGRGFGEKYEPGKDKICVQQFCFFDPFISDFIQSWSDIEVKIRLPSVEVQENPQFMLLKWLRNDEAGQPVYDVFKSPSFTFIIPPDPEISSVSPTSIAAYNHVLQIRGRGFEPEFLPQSHQICFDDLCVIPDDREKYLVSWSDTEIKLKVPPFVQKFTNPLFGISLFVPSKNSYQMVRFAQALTVLQPPIPERYYPKMTTGNRYTVTGKNFGDQKGRVWIGYDQLQAEDWKPDSISFLVPDNARNGELFIETAEGLKSPALPVEIDVVKRYSDDLLSSRQNYFENIRLAEAWTLTEGIPEVVVAVIDSGVDKTHEDLEGIFWTNKKEIENGVDDDQNGFVDDVFGWNFAENSKDLTPLGEHGTMVASVIAAKKNNRVGFSGIAPNVKIMPLIVTSPTTNADDPPIRVDAVLKAIAYAVDNGASIINLSLTSQFTESYKQVLQYAYDNNVLVIAAAGNDARDLEGQRSSPVCNDPFGANILIGVSSVTIDETISSFSNYGKMCIDISSPGSEIVAAVPKTPDRELPYTFASGTSFASPVVAGVAALLKSLRPDWNVEELKTTLINSARPIDDKNPSVFGKIGKGIVDAFFALSSSKPSVIYSARPGRELIIPKTNETMEMEKPKTAPITMEEPIKTDQILDKKPAPEEKKEIKPPLPKKEIKKTVKKIVKKKKVQKKLTLKQKRQERIKKASNSKKK